MCCAPIKPVAFGWFGLESLKEETAEKPTRYNHIMSHILRLVKIYKECVAVLIGLYKKIGAVSRLGIYFHTICSLYLVRTLPVVVQFFESTLCVTMDRMSLVWERFITKM